MRIVTVSLLMQLNAFWTCPSITVFRRRWWKPR